MPGTLTLVATPIGNLADMSFRAVETLKAADRIACEDTRRSRILCAHYGINARLVSYYREREQERAEQLLGLLLEGKNVALITDAGTPGLSDPGAVLVRRAREAGVTVTAAPGASALLCALALAGLDNRDFYFAGFLPASRKARQDALARLAALPCPLVFYEAPHRLAASLQDMADILGERQAQLFRELTKLHEERLRGTLAELALRAEAGLKGEMVLVVEAAPPAPPAGPEETASLLRRLRDQGLSLKDAAREAARKLALPRKQAYQTALALWSEAPENKEETP